MDYHSTEMETEEAEAFLIGILGATSGVLIGIAGGYVLSGMVPYSK